MSAHHGDYAAVIDRDGDLQPAPGATITYRDQTDTTPLTLFSDDALTLPLANPFTAAAVTGRFEAYIAAPVKSMLTVQYGNSVSKAIVEFVDPNVTGAISLPSLAGDVTGTPSATLIAPGVVTTLKLADAACTGLKLGSDVLTTSTFFSGAVVGTSNSLSIPAGTITGAEMAAATVTSAQVDTSVEITAHKAAASGYASLDSTTKVPTAQMGTGTADATHFLRGDRTWQLVGSGANTPWQLPADFQAPASGDYQQMRMSVATTVTAFHAQRTGGTGATIDVLKNGVSILTAPLSLTATTDMTGTLVASPNFAIGDICKIVLSGVSGSPSDIIASLDGSRLTF